MRGQDPLTLTLDLSRASNAGNPYDFVFAPQCYRLHGRGGGVKECTFPWNQAVLDDLAAVRMPGRDPVVIQRIGVLLRDFLAPTRWPVLEAELCDAVDHGRQVVVAIRAAAAELYALPWELLTIESTGQHIGELPEVLVRYEWPDTRTRRPAGPQTPDRNRFLLAWSGHVPADEHRAAVHDACEAGGIAFDAGRDVLPHASCGGLSRALAAAAGHGRPVGILHLLCHGAAAGSTFGLALDGDEPGDARAVVDAGRLRQILAPHAATLRLVVLAACDSGNAGDFGNQIGSVAQELHRVGIATVIASRFPLSASGSVRLAKRLYETLVVDRSTVEHAFLAARRDLAEDAAQLDWASLQLYARADGNANDAAEPAGLDPLRSPEAREQLSQFRALFGGTRRQIALLGRYKALHDALQDLEVPFNAIVPNQKRLLRSAKAWDELRDPLERMQMHLKATLRVLAQDRLRDEFAISTQRLVTAGTLLAAAMAGDVKKLRDALHHLWHVLGCDLSSANQRLLTAARELDLREVVDALTSVAASLDHGRASSASLGELRRLVARLGELDSALDRLVREHDQWQAIGNNLRLLVGSGQVLLDDARLSWPIIRPSLDAVLRAALDPDWTHEIETAAAHLDRALAQGADPGTALRDLWRLCNHRFMGVDKQLLRTCEELRQAGDTLDTVLKVINEP
jgi:HPt (histidine-containing phosphotransfer) domain-containing protein